ncbi:MAG: hypothetical protein ABIL58_16510 [Pseudomonadota bacterium]
MNKKIRYYLAIITAVIGGFLLLANQVWEIIKSNYLDWLYIFSRVFIVEIIVSLFIIISIKDIKRYINFNKEVVQTSFKEKFNIIYSVNKKNYVFLFISILLIFATAYQLNKYFSGKRILIKNYPRVMVAEASNYFSDGDIQEALRHMNVCESIFRNDACKEYKEILEKRIENANRLKELYNRISIMNPVKLTILEDIYYLNRDQKFYTEMSERYAEKISSLTDKYRNACNLILNKKYQAAINILNDIQLKAPGFGDCHVLLYSLNNKQYSNAYLRNLIENGVEKFCANTMHFNAPKKLKNT